MLQFGHDLSAVETLSPLPSPETYLQCFNSATTFQPWKPGTLTNCTFPTLNQLQFGHDLSAVETLSTPAASSKTIMLQFGHDLSAVETA